MTTRSPMVHRARLAPGASAALAMLAVLAACTAGARRPTTAPRPATAPAASAAVPAATATAAVPGDSLPFDPLVRRGVLANGMRYYVRRNTRPEKRAELRLVVNAGSVLEDEDQRGLAHFVEHMAFNGTTHFRKSELVSYLESIGMHFGADLNAQTTFDETVYMLQVPTDSVAAFRRGFEILEDWGFGQTLDSAEIDKERGVVLEEWRYRQGAGMRMLAKQLPVLFAGAKYATRLPIGGAEPLRTFRHDALRRFYRTWYAPDLMAVVAVGDFDADSVVRLIRDRFGKIPAPATPTARPRVEVPPGTGTAVAIATDPEATGSSVSVLWKLPPRPTTTVADYRQSLLEGLHDAMLNSRFGELAQKPDAPFLGAGSGRGGFVRSAQIYQLSANVNEGGVVRGLEGLLTEGERAARHGFVAAELARQKAELLSAYEQQYQEREKTNSAAYAQEYATAFLEGEAAPGIAAEWALVQRLLPTITLEEINAFARRSLAADGRVVLVNAPEKAGLAPPTEAELRAVFDRVQGASIAAWVDSTATGALVERAPAPGKIVARTTHADVGVTEWRLSNGVRVFVKPTDFKADEVLFNAFSPGGLSLAPDSVIVPASTALIAVSSGGVGRFSAVDLGKALSGKQVQVAPEIGDLYEGLAGVTTPRDLETALQLAYLYVTAPRRDSSAFAATRQRIEAFVRNRGASPQAVFEDTMAATMSQYSPREPLFTTALVQRLDLDRSLAFYRDRFADAGDFTFVFVGNVTPAQLEPLVTRWIATLPATRRTEAWRDPRVDPPAGVVTRVVTKGVEPKSQTRLVFHGPATPTPAERQAMAALREVLTIRLRDALREEKGGTYGVGVAGGISSQPKGEYTLAVNFGAAPERIEELTAVVMQQIDSLQRHDVTAEELQKVKELQRRALETAQRQNGWWAGRLTTALQEGRPLGAALEQRALVDAVTPAAIRAAAARYLDRSRYVRGVLYPEGFTPPAK